MVRVLDYQQLAARLGAIVDGLSPQLRRAACYVLDRPQEVALYSMRQVAGRAAVNPSTMVRLAQRVGFKGYNEFRDVFRGRLRQAPVDYGARARALQARHVDAVRLGLEMAEADLGNVARTYDADASQTMARCAGLLDRAHRIYVVGLRSGFPAAFYFHYAAAMFRRDVLLLRGTGGTFADELRDIGTDDALLAVGFAPYTRGTVNAVDYAAQQDAAIVAVTDAMTSPLALAADEFVVVANDSPFFLQSVTAAMSVMQSLVALLLAGGGKEALRRLGESERQLASFNAYWEDARSSQSP